VLDRDLSDDNQFATFLHRLDEHLNRLRESLSAYKES
jgi:hypothetical protein